MGKLCGDGVRTSPKSHNGEARIRLILQQIVGNSWEPSRSEMGFESSERSRPAPRLKRAIPVLSRLALYRRSRRYAAGHVTTTNVSGAGSASGPLVLPPGLAT